MSDIQLIIIVTILLFGIAVSIAVIKYGFKALADEIF